MKTFLQSLHQDERLLIIVAVASLFLIFGASRAKASDPPSIPDGEWVGYWTLSGEFDTGQSTFPVNYQGQIHFVSQGGQLEGVWTLGGSGAYTDPDANIVWTAQGDGEISGASDDPQMSATDFIAYIEGVVLGTHVNTTSDNLVCPDRPPTHVEIISSSCNQVIGRLPAAFINNLAYEDANAAPGGSWDGTWVVTRIGGFVEGDQISYRAATNDLASSSLDFEAKVRASMTVDWNELDALLQKAEDLTRSLQQSDECGSTGEGQWLSAMSGVVLDIGSFALENSAAFSNLDLARLYLALVRTGVVGAGAVDRATADKLEAEFTELFDERLTQSLEDDDCDGAIHAGAGTSLLGSDRLDNLANEVIVSVCGGN